MKKLIIIGAGPGGYEVAIEASKEDLEVIIIDKGELKIKRRRATSFWLVVIMS